VGSGVSAARDPLPATIHPQVVARAGELVFFWCRWETDRPLPVAFPGDASAQEETLLRVALEAWESAGLGVRFVREDAVRAAIVIDLVDGPVATAAGFDAGNSVTECRIAGDPRTALDRVPARLERARIRLARRTSSDWRGHTRVLSPAEFLGAALHEVGHALGISGHAPSGETVMVREVDRVRRTVARLLKGGMFRDAHLAALYRLPNGSIARRASVDPGRTRLLDELWDRAMVRGLEGPFVRSGETRAHIFWRLGGTAKGGTASKTGIAVVNWRETLREPERVRFVPGP